MENLYSIFIKYIEKRELETRVDDRNFWERKRLQKALTLFPLRGYQFGTSLLFSLHLRNGFHSESEDVKGKRVKGKVLYKERNFV